MLEAIICLSIVGVSFIGASAPWWLDWAEEVTYWLQSRRRKSGVDELERRIRHQKTLARIDKLERELEIGKYSPAAKELDRMLADQAVRERRERQLTFDRTFGERLKRPGMSVYELKAEIVKELGYNASGDYVDEWSEIRAFGD